MFEKNKDAERLKIKEIRKCKLNILAFGFGRWCSFAGVLLSTYNICISGREVMNNNNGFIFGLLVGGILFVLNTSNSKDMCRFVDDAKEKEEKLEEELEILRTR